MYRKCSLFLYYYLLIIVLFSIQTTVNLLLPHPVFKQLKTAMTKSDVNCHAGNVSPQRKGCVLAACIYVYICVYTCVCVNYWSTNERTEMCTEHVQRFVC